MPDIVEFEGKFRTITLKSGEKKRVFAMKEHSHSGTRAHSRPGFKPEGRVMPSVRDAKDDHGKIDLATMAAHLDAVKSSMEQGEYTADQADVSDGTLTVDQVKACKSLGISAQVGWDFVIMAGKRQQHS